MQWFRWYHGTCADPKFGSIARACGATRERVIATWAMILEAASDADERGAFVIDAAAIADLLHCKTSAIQTILDDMHARGMIADGRVTKWRERQPSRDDSAPRVRKMRAKAGDGDADVTRSSRDGDADVTPSRVRPRSALETDTETEGSDANASAPTSGAARPTDPLKAQIFGPVLAYLRHSTGQSEAACRKLLGGWSRDYGDGAVIEAVTRAEHEGPNDPVPSIITTLKGRANGAKRGVAGSGRRPPGDDYRAEMLEGLGIAGDVAARQAGAAGGRSRDALRVVGEDIPF